MNDDLEERLHELRPAALPRDLRRSLRSADASFQTKRDWRWVAALLGQFRQSRRLIGAGWLAASALAFAVWSLLLPRPLDLPGRFANTVQATNVKARPQENVAFRADHGRGVPFDFNSFRSAPLLTYAARSGGPNTKFGGGFHLETPAGPIQLDCGYTLAGNKSDNDLFGEFNLNVSDSF